MTTPELVEFTKDDRAVVVDRLEQLQAVGRGWVNLLPEVAGGDDLGPRRPGPAEPRGVLSAAAGVYRSLFSSRGPGVPLATWTPPRQPGRGARVGIEHATGPRATQRLADAGTPIPAGWRRVQDHPRTGLVVDPPPTADPAEVLAWLLAAAAALCPVPLTGAWLAEVHRG